MAFNAIRAVVLSLACAGAYGGLAAELEPGFERLFNGTDLQGWDVRGGQAKYAVTNGTIVASPVPGMLANSFLCTRRSFADFELKLEFKVIDGNSGVQFRSFLKPAGADGIVRVAGYQAEMSASGRWTGRIWDEGRPGTGPKKNGFLDAGDDARLDLKAKEYKVNDWNEMTIVCRGSHIVVKVNGHVVSEIDDTRDAAGFIGLQAHVGKTGDFAWRNIRIREFK